METEVKKDRKALTPRQREVFEFIKERIEQTNRPPTLREIGQRFEISSTNGVRSILAALVKKGFIARSPKLSRGIDLPQGSREPKIPSDFTSDESKVAEVPILGRVAAGAPILAVENLEGTVVVDRDFLMRQQNVFALRVHGDSMTPKYREGDIVIFSPAAACKDGDDCFIRFEDGHTTFKRVFFESGESGSAVIRLQPRNEKYRPQVVPSEQISGMYKAVFKYQRVDEG